MAREAMQTQPHVISQADHDADKAQINQTAKVRRKRSASPPRPAFFVVQVLSDDGQPISFDKRRIKIISVERNAEKVLELIDTGSYENAFYLRGIVPAGRGGPPKTT